MLRSTNNFFAKKMHHVLIQLAATRAHVHLDKQVLTAEPTWMNVVTLTSAIIEVHVQMYWVHTGAHVTQDGKVVVVLLTTMNVRIRPVTIGEHVQTLSAVFNVRVDRVGLDNSATLTKTSVLKQASAKMQGRVWICSELTDVTVHPDGLVSTARAKSKSAC